MVTTRGTYAHHQKRNRFAFKGDTSTQLSVHIPGSRQFNVSNALVIVLHISLLKKKVKEQKLAVKNIYTSVNFLFEHP